MSRSKREPITAAALRSDFACAGRRSIRAASTACTVAGTAISVTLPINLIVAAMAGEDTSAGQIAHDLLDEQRVAPSGLCDSLR